MKNELSALTGGKFLVKFEETTKEFEYVSEKQERSLFGTGCCWFRFQERLSPA